MRIVKVNGMIANRPGVVYCGRYFNGWTGSPLGNPFRIGKDGTLKQVLDKYRWWLWSLIKNKKGPEYDALMMLTNESTLGCWCVEKEAGVGPEECHCDIIFKAWLWLQRNK